MGLVMIMPIAAVLVVVQEEDAVVEEVEARILTSRHG